MASGDLKRVFNPETIALIGATEKDGTPGRDLLENLYYWSKERKLFPVNPSRGKILGLDCYPSISAVPGPVDLAVIATPAHTVPTLVQECGQAEVEGIIIVSSGFKEVGEEGRKLEEQIKATREEYGMRIVGPNCLGVLRPTIALNASLLKAVPKKGNIAFISQSGAMGGAIFNWAILAHVGFSMFASLGSMIDVDFGDLIDFLGSDPYTRSIILYMEGGAGDAKKFMSAVRGFARSKPILVVKPGRWAERTTPAQTQAGTMITSDRVYQAAFKRVGVVRVHEASDLFNTVRVLHSRNLPKGPRVAIVTNAEGVGVMAVDALLEYGGELAHLSEDSLRELNAILPPYGIKSNPIDVLTDATIETYVRAAHLCLDDSNVDGVLILYTFQERTDPGELARAVTELAKATWKPMITAWMGGREIQAGRDILFQHSIPTYEAPEEAVKAYLHLYHYQRSLGLLYETPSELPADQAPAKNDLKAFLRTKAKEKAWVLSEEESTRFLSNYGIPHIEVRVVQGVEDAIVTATRIGYPVAMRIVSPDIPCKSDIGGVVLGVDSDEQLRTEFQRLLARVKERSPHSMIGGVALQKMIDHIDFEMILGAKKDKELGSALLFGMGGKGARTLKDFSVGLPPMNQILARRLMEETEFYKMAQQYSDAPLVDLRQLEQIIVRFSDVITDFPEIAEMEINPLVIAEGKACALGARIVIDPEGLEYKTPYPHLVITPYPTRYIVPWSLSDGTPVLLRPIRPEDEPLVAEMLATLSERTLKERFFQIVKSITHEMLTRLCNIDYDREIRVIAEIKKDQKKQLIGMGALMIEPDFKRGEFSVLVHDHYQAKGIGLTLVDMLIRIGREKALDEIYGIVLPENRKMLQLAQRLGFAATRLPEEVVRITLVLR